MKESDLYKVDMLAFNSKIGYITNLGTTFYEMQSQYEVGSPEYEEINRRLKLCCIEQNRTIDAAKGLKTKPFPKHWTQYQKINEDDTPEEKARKEFENRLVIDKRPEFMRFLYPKYNKEYKAFLNDFNRYSYAKFGKSVEELTNKDKKKPEVQEMLEYYDKKNPLLETDGVMNRLCRHMQNELKGIKSNKGKCDNAVIFDKLYNKGIELDEGLLDRMRGIREEYYDFKKSRQLESSEFSTYEQFYKSLRNKALESISSDIKELANLAVYLCYKEFESKPKDFCWEVFGAGIVENLKVSHETVNVPHLSFDGEIEYLGDRYTFEEYVLPKKVVEEFDDEYLFSDLEIEDDEDVFNLED